MTETEQATAVALRDRLQEELNTQNKNVAYFDEELERARCLARSLRSEIDLLDAMLDEVGR